MRVIRLQTLIWIALVAGMASAEESQSSRPNFLFIISDDQSWLHMGAYGDEIVKTPHFDRLAEEGMLFDYAFCASPGCTVSRSAILTGLNQWQLREAGTHGSNFPRDIQALPEILLEHGYAIGYTGKGWSPGNWRITGRPRNPAGEEYNDHKLSDLPAKFLTTTDPIANFEAFLEDKDADQPFWFWYGSIEPHVKYEKGVGRRNGIDPESIEMPAFVPDHPDAREEMADYYYEIQWFDRQVGWFIERLEEEGLLENTVVVVTSDNGIVLPRCKRNLYEWGTRMPLAIHWGRSVNPGLRTPRLTSFIDFAPTFLELAGIPIPDSMQGSSFAPLFTQDNYSRENFPPYVLTGFERHDHRRFDNVGYPSRAIRTDRYLYIKNYKPDRWPEGDPYVNSYGFELQDPESSWTTYYTYFEPGTKLYEMAFGKRPPEELYDIMRDPECMVNLIEEEGYRTVADGLRQTLEDELVKQGDPRELGYGDIFDSYPRYGPMKEHIGGFKERGQYNPDYHVHPLGVQ